MNRLQVKIRNRLKPVVRALMYARIRGEYHVMKAVASLRHVAGVREIPASCHWKNARYLTLRCPLYGLLTGSEL
jgi:hypothetical protein